MFYLQNCPICNSKKAVELLTEISKIKVYFCHLCFEHFTKEDTVITIIKNIKKENNIIDEEYIKFHNSKIAKIEEKTTKMN